MHSQEVAEESHAGVVSPTCQRSHVITGEAQLFGKRCREPGAAIGYVVEVRMTTDKKKFQDTGILRCAGRKRDDESLRRIRSEDLPSRHCILEQPPGRLRCTGSGTRLRHRGQGAVGAARAGWGHYVRSGGFAHCTCLNIRKHFRTALGSEREGRESKKETGAHSDLPGATYRPERGP